MSDPYDPYGQQSSSGQTNPYGQSGSEAATSGGYGQPEAPAKRPGTVTAAAVITILLSALVLVGSVIVAVALIAVRDDVTAEIEKAIAEEPSLESVSAASITNGALAVVLVVLVWSLIAIVLAVLAMRRQNWARITLVISAVLSLALSLLGTIAAVFPAVWLIGAIAVIVLLFTGGANQWYAGRSSTWAT